MQNDAALQDEKAAPSYPMPRVCPVDPPPQLAGLRAGPAASKVTLWDGSQVWLVTSHAGVRAVLGDRRFTAVTSAPGFPMLTRTSQLVRAAPHTASFIRMDDPDHSRLRSMLTRDFLARRAEEMRPVLRELLDEMLSALVSSGERPVDLVTGLTTSVPSKVITLLFGVSEGTSSRAAARSSSTAATPPTKWPPPATSWTASCVSWSSSGSPTRAPTW